MGRKKAGGGTPADLGQLKLEVVLDVTQAEQFKNLCTILMQSPGQLAKEMVLDAMWKETLQVLKSVALSYSAELPDLQGTLADQYPPGSSQAREKCEGTCSGKCTLAQPDLDPGQLTQAAISGTLTDRLNSTSGNLTKVRRVQAQSEAETGLFNLGPEATLADYVFCTENGLRGGEADEESLQKKQGTPTADQYPLHGHHLSNPSGPISDPSNNT